jgi:hypothetical protein
MTNRTETTTPASAPPETSSNEATDEQLRIAHDEGDAYGRALQSMAEEDGAHLAHAGDFLVAFVNEEAEGMYALADGLPSEQGKGELVWREAAEKANCHLEVAVADAADGRFVPQLSVRVELTRGGERVLYAPLPFLWHPFLHHYGTNAELPDEGPFDVTVRIDAPTFMRHDPINGKRYGEPVTVRFDGVRFTNGRKPSPAAEPRGGAAPTTRASG